MSTTATYHYTCPFCGEVVSRNIDRQGQVEQTRYFIPIDRHGNERESCEDCCKAFRLEAQAVQVAWGEKMYARAKGCENNG